MRYIGLDYGSVTCGVALTDETRTISSPKETIRYKSLDELLNKLDLYFNEYEIDKIILGDPLNLDGSVSDRCKLTYLFKEELENRYNKEVILIDERLTTVIANNTLLLNNTRRDKRKKVVDKLAATIILDSYLERIRNEK